MLCDKKEPPCSIARRMAWITNSATLTPVPETIGQMLPASVFSPFRITLAEMLCQSGKVLGNSACLQGMPHEKFRAAAAEVPAQHGEIRFDTPQAAAEAPGKD